MAFLNEDEQIILMRNYDPGKGSFAPMSTQWGGGWVERPPIATREHNPRGSRHINKTEQDYMPKDQRPRVKEANRQLELRRQGR